MVGNMEFPSDIAFKEIFESKLLEYEEQHKGSQRKPWTRQKINEVISQVRHGKESKQQNQRRTSMEYYWMSRYDIIATNNEYHLIFKKKILTNPTIRIIPRDEYFQVIKDIHESLNHGGRDKVMRALKKVCYIPKKAIEIFVALCPTCEMKKSTPRKGAVRPIISQGEVMSEDLNITGQFDLIDLQCWADGDYKWLLSYQDDKSKFLSLRPLKSNQPKEVAMELLKIFMIFGAPYVLASDNGSEFISEVIEKLTVIWPGKIVGSQTQESKEKNNVENLLRLWMSDNNSSNWSLGCHFVQYQINTSFHSTIGKTPYKALFGIDTKTALNTNSVPDNIRYTEGTQISDQEYSDNIDESNIKLKKLKTECIWIEAKVEPNEEEL